MLRSTMTYVRSQKRFTKGYRGKMYSVSLRQLSARYEVELQNKEQATHYANLWWDDFARNLDAAERSARRTPAVLAAERVEQFTSALPVDELEAIARRGQAALQALRALGQAQEQRTTEELYRPGRAAGLLAELQPPPAAGRSIAQQVKVYLDLHRANPKSDPATTRNVDYTLRRFVQFIGADVDVSAITPAKWEEFWSALALKVREGAYSNRTAGETMMQVRSFINRLSMLGTIAPLANLNDKRLRFSDSAAKIKTFPADELARLFRAAPERTRLYMLLCLNCGMLQADVADLGTEEVDWTEGTITRQRSKRRDKPNAQTVCYRLWPETLALLAKYRQDDKGVMNESGSARVILSDKGKPMASHRWEDGKVRNYNNITAAYKVLCGRVGIKTPMKALRKTAASTLAKHPVYKFYSQYFLAHAPRSVADRHYVIPSQDEFDAAVAWLRTALDVPTIVGG